MTPHHDKTAGQHASPVKFWLKIAPDHFEFTDGSIALRAELKPPSLSRCVVYVVNHYIHPPNLADPLARHGGLKPEQEPRSNK